MNNWSDYPILLEIAETGSLTAAGKKLQMSQPTVGRRLRALEEHFGTPLLKKESGKLIPTTFGQSVLDHVRRMQDEAAAINRSSASLEDSLSGVVRISATEGIGTAWLPTVLQAFRQSHPDIMFDVSIGFRSFNLAQREADIALRWKSPGEQNSLIARKVADATFGLFASPSYLQKKGVPQSLDDLKNHDAVIAMVMDDMPLWMHDEAKNPIGMPERVTFRTNNIWAFNSAITEGYGIGAMPICSCDILTDKPLIRVLPNLSQQEALYLVAHEDVRRSTRIRAVYDFIADAMKKDSAFFLNGGESVFQNGANLHCGTDHLDNPAHKHVLVAE
ncbi:MAG: LysR family transcriptional regulator [Hellea sp.]|nr:LysR family transcriptional regulator [Hellea sp.]